MPYLTVRRGPRPPSAGFAIIAAAASRGWRVGELERFHFCSDVLRDVFRVGCEREGWTVIGEG